MWRLGSRRAARGAYLVERGTSRTKGDPQRLEGLGGHALAFGDEPEEDVLAAHGIVVKATGFLSGKIEDPSGRSGDMCEQLDPPRVGRPRGYPVDG